MLYEVITMSGLGNLLGRGITGRPGVQHVLDAAYYRRMDAIERNNFV